MADNFAYDLSLFEHRERKAKTAPKIPPRALPQSRLRIWVVLVGRIALGLAVGVVLCVGIYSRVVLTETVDQITDAKSELTRLESEQTRLAMELDGKVSIKSIEEYATGTLGLNRMEDYQITYLSLAGDDRIEQTATEKKKPFSLDINELFYRLVEYIN